MARSVIFYQMFEPESSTYTYLLADPKTHEAVLIDPVIETLERDIELIKDEGLKLLYTIDTHVHADHVTGASAIRQRLQSRAAVSKHSGVDCADLLLQEGDEIQFGSKKVKVLETPGHTDSCLSLVVDDMVFTGDALLIRGCGRTDFQQGSSEKLYRSVTQKLFTLPDDTIVYPAHDYKGRMSSTIAMEKKWNPRLGGSKSEAEFSSIMRNLKLDPPKKIAASVPANMRCGSLN